MKGHRIRVITRVKRPFPFIDAHNLTLTKMATSVRSVRIGIHYLRGVWGETKCENRLKRLLFRPVGSSNYG